MRYLLLPVFIFIGWSTSLAQQESIHPCAKHKIAHAEKMKSGQKALNGQENYDLHYVKLDLDVANTSTAINSGHATLNGRVVAFNLDVFVLELASSLQVDSVKLAGDLALFNRIGDELQVFPPTNLNQGESFSLDVYYRGNPPGGGGFFGGIFNATSPSWGAQVTWTLSQPFSAHTWWPCKQELTDKIDSCEIWLTVPQGMKGGANGILQQEVALAGGKTRFEWKHNHPIAYYLLSIAVGPYIDYSFNAPLPGTTESVFIQNYIYDNPATLNNFMSDIDLTGDMMYVFSDLYGLYPFRDEKYGHCMAPLSGGMEHQTMTTQGFFETGLTAHELGHQWFGDYVTCSDWGHIWVNEGFASYSEYLFIQTLNQNSAQQRMAGVHNNVMSQGNGSVYVPLDEQDSDSRIFSSRLTYDKGSALVHMIRHWVNDDNLFFQAMKTYMNDFANSTATAEDFVNAVESVTGVSMEQFLAHWYYGEGFPTYSGRYNNVGNRIVVELSQTTSMPAVTPFFKSAIEIEIEFMDNSDTVIYVMNSVNGQNYVFDIDKEIYAVDIDPENWVLNAKNSFEADPSLEITGIRDELEAEMLFTIYPNPSKNYFNLTLEAKEGEVEIFDNLGRLVMEFPVSQGNKKVEHTLSTGVYTLLFQSKEARAMQQLVIK